MTTGLLGFFAVMAALVLVTCGIALLPALLFVGAFMLVFTLVFGLIAGILGFIVRIIGALVLLALAVPLALATVGVMFAVGIALLHAALPLLLLIGLVWLIAHHRRSAPRISPTTRAA